MLGHHPNIEAALKVYEAAAPCPARQASAALHILLQEIYNSHDDLAWQFSRLTGDGFPLEFAFSVTDTDIRYTTEVASPQIPAAECLYLACLRLKQLGQPEVPAALLNPFIQAQQGKKLNFGAWVGGRHSLKGDAFKLYIEVPEYDRALLQALKLPSPSLADRSAVLRMVGYHLTSGRVEVYYRVPNLQSYHLLRVMAPCGLNGRSGDLQELLEEAYGYRLTKVPGGTCGISYAIPSNGSPAVFTLFMFARAFWGGDAAIRRKTLALADKYGWNLSLYRQITEKLSTRNTWKTYHGLLGFVVAPSSPIALSLGVRPWLG